jgi:hypothetical protein
VQLVEAASPMNGSVFSSAEDELAPNLTSFPRDSFDAVGLSA